MTLPRWLRWRSNAELDEEIRAHLELEIEANLGRGMSPEEARRAARRRFGNPTAVRERALESDPLAWLKALVREIRFAIRRLAGSPSYAIAAILTLALGVGATTAVFSVAEPLLARRLPVSSPEELVLLRTVDPTEETARDRVPDQLFHRLTADSRLLAEILAFSVSRDLWSSQNLVIEGEDPNMNAEAVEFEMVTGNYFEVLGLESSFGRLLMPTDDQPGADAVAVISHQVWMQRFGGSPEAVGRQISLRHPLGLELRGVIVGVAPPGFEGLDIDVSADVWVPFQISGRMNPESMGSFPGVRVVARKREGVGLPDIQTELDALSVGLAEETWAIDRDGRVHVRADAGAGGYSDQRFRFSTPVLALGAAAGLVLLIVWINLAALMLTRGLAHGREMAVRLALGSGRRGILGHFLAEGLILALTGGVAGSLVAVWGHRLLVSFLPPGTAFVSGGSPGVRVLLFAAGVSLVGAVAFAIVPGSRLSGIAIAPLIQASNGRGARTASSPAAERAIVGAQIAIAFVLLVGAGLFLRTLGNLRAEDIGLDTDSRVEFDVRGELSRLQEFSEAGLARIDGLPGVESTTAYDRSGLLGGERFDVRAFGPAGTAENVLVMQVGLRFFETMGIPVISGAASARGQDTFWRRDGVAGVVVSESLASRLFGEEDPVGQRLLTLDMTNDSSGEPPESGTAIIAVAADVRHEGPRSDSRMVAYYLGVAPFIFLTPRFAVKVEGEASAFLPALRRTIQDFDGDLRIGNIQTLDQAREALIAPERLAAHLAVLLGLASLALASIGTFGTFWYSVTRRSSEIGIRMALGAQRRSVIGLFMREAGWVVGTGVVTGLLAAAGVTRLMTIMLFGVAPLDPTVLGLAALVLIAASLVAAWLPARRASCLDPMEALRHE